MPIYLQAVETRVPETEYAQDFIRDLTEKSVGASGKTARYIRRIYRHSGIETRHSVIRDFSPSAPRIPFFTAGPGGSLTTPDTRTRNSLYVSESRPLFTELARAAIANCPNARAADITHVITVSCTGFYSPGPDYAIVRELGLAGNVRRFHVGFMGCQAAFPALKMAAAFCGAEPGAVVLIVCVELCSLHLQFTDNPDAILAGALFADGGAAAIVSCREPAPGQSVYELRAFDSALVPDTEAQMAWLIGNQGFDIVLSNSIPDIIDANIRQAVAPLLQSRKLDTSDIDTWAVHPGGKAILDKMERNLGLKPEQIRPSREVLRRYGNMSSATILFVLSEILRAASSGPRRNVCAVAFGPGLTTEMGLLALRPAQSEAAATSPRPP